MASWSQVENFLVAKGFKNEKGLWTGHVTLPEGRSQMIILFEVDVEGEALDSLVYNSPFASTSEISAEKVLELTGSMPFGVSAMGGFYTLRDQVQIADVSESELMGPVFMMAHFADKLEKQIGGTDKF